jgi:hypothetical protein
MPDRRNEGGFPSRGLSGDTLTTDDIFNQFAAQIRNGSAWPQSPRSATLTVMAALHACCTVPGAPYPRKLYYKGCRESYSQEFMLDFCCMDAKSNEILLAAESEWSAKAGDVEDDFQKLVYTKARFKIMIFGTDPRSVFERATNFLRLYPCNNLGDMYIFAHISNDGAVRGWKLKIDRDGPLSSDISPILI